MSLDGLFGFMGLSPHLVEARVSQSQFFCGADVAAWNVHVLYSSFQTAAPGDGQITCDQRTVIHQIFSDARAVLTVL